VILLDTVTVHLGYSALTQIQSVSELEVAMRMNLVVAALALLVADKGAAPMRGPIGPPFPEKLRGPIVGSRSVVNGCNGQACTLLSGNTNCCSNRCTGSVTIGPHPGTAAINAQVKIGATPHSFNIAGDKITDSGVFIDFGNGTNSGKLSLNNEVGVTASTTYQNAGRFNIHAMAADEHEFVANDWNCTFRCCRYDDSFIDIQ
jgi:hypothetical protein